MHVDSLVISDDNMSEKWLEVEIAIKEYDQTILDLIALGIESWSLFVSD